jgi:hypothetical protein
MAWVAPVVAGAASVIGGILGNKGAKAQANAAKIASENAERARRESLANLDNRLIYNTSSWLFPGMVSAPNTTGIVGTGMPGSIPGGARPTAPAGLATAEAIAGRREHGGPVEGGKPYLVGEAGPEMVVPEGDEEEMPAPKGGALSDEQVAEIVQLIMMVVQGGMKGGADGSGGVMGDQGMMPAQPTEGLPMAPESMPMGAGGGMPPMAPGRAAGGPVAAGQPYVVGEQGPEVIRPSQPGTVVPNPGTPGGPPPAAGQPTPTYGAPQQGIQGGATAAPQPARFNTPGEAATGWTNYLFNHPGEISPAGYHREQEQANQQLQTGVMGVAGGLSGQGADPNSALGQSLTGAVTAAAGKQRSEAARDFSLAGDQMARQDISQAFNQYLQSLQLAFGIQQARASAAGGQAFPQVQIGNPNAGLAAGIAQAGYGVGQYFDQRNQQSQGGILWDRPASGGSQPAVPA